MTLESDLMPAGATLVTPVLQGSERISYNRNNIIMIN